MANLSMEIKQTEDRSQAIKDAINELKNLEILVGIPQENNKREKGGPITNAELLFIHTNGSPVNNIPPRPVLEPAVRDDMEVISDFIKQAGEKAFQGDKEGMRKELDKAGQRAENSAKGWFTNPKNGWADIKDSTKERREKRMTKKKLETAYAKAEADENFIVHRPLIDRAEMRKAITHVVRKRKG